MLHTSPHQLRGSVLSARLGSEGTLGQLKFDEVELMPRQILLSEGMPVDYIYLIQSGLVSLLRSMEDGATVEVGLVGRDGFAGLEIVLGSNTSRFQGVVQIGGSALRIRARTLREPETMFSGTICLTRHRRFLSRFRRRPHVTVDTR